MSRPDTSITPLDSPGAVAAAMTAYRAAASRRWAALRSVLDVRREAAQLRDALRTIEAEVAMNGGYAEVIIDGKNAERRAAQLTMALTHHPGHRAIQARLRELEHAIAEADLAADEAYDQLRAARLHIEWATSWNHRTANTVMEERNAKEH